MATRKATKGGLEVAIDQLAKELQSHREETREDFKELRSDVKDIKVDVADLRVQVAEVKAQRSTEKDDKKTSFDRLATYGALFLSAIANVILFLKGGH